VDFGIVGNLDDPLKEKLCGLMVSVNNRDLNGVLDAILELNIADGDVNEAKLRNDIREGLDIWYVRSAKEYVAGDLIKLAKLAREDNVKLPLDFVLLTKQILTLDGVGKLLDPDFNYAKELEPYVKKFQRDQLTFEKIKQRLRAKGQDLAVFLDKLPRHLLSAAQKLEKGKIKLEIEPKEIKEITHLTHELESASEKIALALLIGAIAVGAAILANVEKLPRIYGWPLSNIIFVIAALMGLWLILSILRGRG
jgi:ubiquinone biosynthesis protein